MGRGGLPRRLRPLPARPDAPALGGGDRRRRRDRPHRRDRGRVGAARQPHQRRAPVNGGLGAARNLGVTARARRLPRLPRLRRRRSRPTAYADLVGALDESGSDFATGSIVRWEAGGLVEPPWMRRLHRPAARRPGRGPARGPRRRVRVEQGVPPLVLGRARAWPGRRACATRTSPTTTRAFLDGTLRRARRGRSTTGGSGRARSPRPGRRRCRTSPTAGRRSGCRWPRCAAHGDAEVERVFVDRVLAGDLWRYFLLVPGCTPEWWRLLRSGVLELWGTRLVDSGLPPVHRLAGWLVAEDRRADVTALMEWCRRPRRPGARAPRTWRPAPGGWRSPVGARRDDRATRGARAARPRG